MTDYFEEYSYNGRKFIRYQVSIDNSNDNTLSNNDTINQDEFYWIEVKPLDLSKGKTLYSEFTTEKRRRT